MGRGPPEVIVVDSEKRFLEYIHPGKAGWLIRNGEAKVFSKKPFAIMLLKSVSPSSIRRKTSMATPRNFTDYFKEEKDIFVQNIANAQVSAEFPIDNNRVEGFTFPPSRDPINLTQHIPFDAIKRSMDFRKLLSRRPAVLQILDDTEYQAYFAKRASNTGMLDTDGKPDAEAAMDASEEKRRRTADKATREQVTNVNPEPIHEILEKGSGPGGATKFGERERVGHSDIETEDEVINPKVLHYCNQVKAEIPEEERMPARDLLEALEGIPNLSLDDLEHIRAHAFYKTVKKWARTKMAEMATVHEDEDGHGQGVEVSP